MKMIAETLPSIKIERRLYEHNQLRQDLNYEKTKKSCKYFCIIMPNTLKL